MRDVLFYVCLRIDDLRTQALMQQKQSDYRLLEG